MAKTSEWRPTDSQVREIRQQRDNFRTRIAELENVQSTIEKICRQAEGERDFWKQKAAELDKELQAFVDDRLEIRCVEVAAGLRKLANEGVMRNMETQHIAEIRRLAKCLVDDTPARRDPGVPQEDRDE